MSVELATIYQGVKTGVSIVKIVLRYLDNSFDSLFREIAEVHYTSVRQAFADAERMNDVERRNFEIQVARVHLRDTFNAYQHFLNRKRKVFSTPISADKKAGALSRCIEIATLIALTYAEVGEEPNAKAWRDEAWRQFAIYEPVYRKLARSDSYAWDPGPPKKRVFDEPYFQRMLQELESDRVQLDQIFRVKGIA